MIRFAIWLLLITTSLLFIVAADQDTKKYDNNDELDEAAPLFIGDIEVVASNPEMVWPEGPLYSESGNYILFSDNQYIDPTTNFKCGMIWKYDIEEDKLSKLLNCSGIVGPPGLNANQDGLPHDIRKIKEPGSNGLLLSDDDKTVLMSQHAWGRIVQFNVDDIDTRTMSIDEDLVTVIVDSYNGMALNSPNDLYLDDDDLLYFTDPPFGKQYDEDEEPFITMLDRMSQDVPAVYSINIGEDDKVEEDNKEDNEERREPIRILEYPVSKDAPKPQVPNGIGINTENDDLAVVMTDFSNPRVNIYKRNDDGTIDTKPKKVLEMKKKYEDMPFALSDGLSFNSDHKLFVNGPAGIYIYKASEYDDNNDDLDEYEMLGFLRLDDLCSNNISGGGYLWITCAKGLLRIALASPDTTIEKELTSDERHELRRHAMYETINEFAFSSGGKGAFSSEQEQRAYYYLHSGITTIAMNTMKMSTSMSDYDIDEILDNDDQFLQYLESLLESELKRVSSERLKKKKVNNVELSEESESKHKLREKGDLKDYYSQIYAQEHKHFKCKNHSNISTIAEAEQKWAELHNAFIKFTVGVVEHAVEPLIPDSDLYIKFTTNGTDTNKTSATVPRLYAAKNFSRDDVVYTSKKASLYFASASQWVGFLHSLPKNQVCTAIEFSLMKQISRPGRYLFGLVLDEGVFMRQEKGKGNVALEDDRNFAYLATQSIKEGEEIIDDGSADEETRS